MPFADAAQAKDSHKLELFGGSPFNKTDLPTEGVPKPTNSFLSRIGIGSKNKDPSRFISVKTTQFVKMKPDLKHEISVLPSNCLVLKPLVGFAKAFRIHCFNKLEKTQQNNVCPQQGLTIRQFAKVYDCPEIQRAISECWEPIASLPN